MLRPCASRHPPILATAPHRGAFLPLACEGVPSAPFPHRVCTMTRVVASSACPRGCSRCTSSGGKGSLPACRTPSKHAVHGDSRLSSNNNKCRSAGLLQCVQPSRGWGTGAHPGLDAHRQTMHSPASHSQSRSSTCGTRTPASPRACTTGERAVRSADTCKRGGSKSKQHKSADGRLIK
jgi:hypothetical protein